MKQPVNTDSAPKPVGPYSQAVKVGGLIFTSGQIPIDPASGTLVEGIEAATERVMQNLDTVLKAGGSSLQKAVKTTIFLTDMGQFAKVNEVYSRFFQPPFPARSTVQVAALPKGVAVEIEVVAEA
ncbi:MAG: RidA family protein [bacterium]